MQDHHGWLEGVKDAVVGVCVVIASTAATVMGWGIKTWRNDRKKLMQLEDSDKRLEQGQQELRDELEVVRLDIRNNQETVAQVHCTAKVTESNVNWLCKLREQELGISRNHEA